MVRQPVESSNLKSVGYDPGTKTLEIEFQNGGVYQYHEVPQTVYRELMNADSHGRYFISAIKGAFPFTRVSRSGRSPRGA